MTSVNVMSQISSNALKQTTITPHLETEISPEKNVVYCATFQLTWNQLIDDVIKAPLQLEGNPLMAQILNKRYAGGVNGYNKRTVDQHIIAEDCYLAMAGLQRNGIVEQVKKALKEKFHQIPGMDLTLREPDNILAYAYLEKNLPFSTVFDVFDKPLLFSDDVEIQSFGIEKSDAAAGQVLVLDYRNSDDFILRLQQVPQFDLDWEVSSEKHSGSSDDIILAKITPQATILDTLDSIIRRTGKEAYLKALEKGRSSEPKLSSEGSEILQIPKIKFNILHRYTELTGKSLLSPGMTDYFIARALQAIKFKLDEKGAELSSEGFMGVGLSIAREKPRQFVFDKPFFICLKEKNARYPYLAVWINNFEILVKA